MCWKRRASEKSSERDREKRKVFRGNILGPSRGQKGVEGIGDWGMLRNGAGLLEKEREKRMSRWDPVWRGMVGEIRGMRRNKGTVTSWGRGSVFRDVGEERG